MRATTASGRFTSTGQSLPISQFIAPAALYFWWEVSGVREILRMWRDFLEFFSGGGENARLWFYQAGTVYRYVARLAAQFEPRLQLIRYPAAV